MKIELVENKVYFNNGSEKKEIHPFWLRERVNGEEYLDKGTQQRLFDPTFLNNDVSINKAKLNEKYLEVDFNDGVNSKLEIDNSTKTDQDSSVLPTYPFEIVEMIRKYNSMNDATNPSDAIDDALESFKSFVLRSTTNFSSLKFGIPYISNPPGLSYRS